MTTTPTTELFTRSNSGRYQPANKQTICETAASYVQPITGDIIHSPQDTEVFLQAKMAHLEHEVFSVIYLDNRHRVIAYVEEFRGTVDGTSVYPREIVKAALRHNAAAIILAHNHPSGITEPSNADERITSRLKAACNLIDVRLLDHLIIGKGQCTSLASKGLL